MEDRDFAAEYLFTHKIATAKPYNELNKYAAELYNYEGDCPVSEQFLNRVLIVPNHYGLKKGETVHIVKCLNRCWEMLCQGKNH